MAVVAACVQVALVEVGCVQAAWAEVALTGVRSLGTASGMPGPLLEFQIRSQIGPTSADLAGLTWVYPAGLATGPTSVCLADPVTGLAGPGAAADGAATIGQDTVGAQPPWERVWRIQQPAQIIAIPIMHPMAIAILDMARTDMVRPDMVRMDMARPDMARIRLPMKRLRALMVPTRSRIAPDASVRTIRQVRPIFRTAVSGFRAHNGHAKVVRERLRAKPRNWDGIGTMPSFLLADREPLSKTYHRAVVSRRRPIQRVNVMILYGAALTAALVTIVAVLLT